VSGAAFVGSAACAKCHASRTREFHHATHARVTATTEDGTTKEVSCETCHGGGSLHVKAGTRETIVNPKTKPDSCLHCHPDTRAEFGLPHAHPLLAGKVSCADCHNPHVGDANRSDGARTLAASVTATCAKCHPAQTAPFVFQHEVMREGCVTCHSPHGAVNDKLLKARGASLCYQCHFQPQSGNAQLLHGGFNHAGGQNGNIMTGTCWSAGCHEAVHGSNVSSNLRY
jgi:DmsE family decaheme c-type cytochrome